MCETRKIRTRYVQCLCCSGDPKTRAFAYNKGILG